MVRWGLEGPTPKWDPGYTAPGTKEGLTSPRSTGALEVVHLTVQWEQLRPERGREQPQFPQNQRGSGLLAPGSFLPEAPTEPPRKPGCGILLYREFKKKKNSAGNPGDQRQKEWNTRHKRSLGLRKGGWADEPSKDRRVWYKPKTSREPRPPNFPPPSIRALQPRGTCRKRGRGGAGPPGLAGSGFILPPLQPPQECPWAGGREPWPLEVVALTLQLLQEPGGSGRS